MTNQANSRKHPLSIAVIGAGVCGLSAAHKLSQSGLNVTVFEKSRGVGGRLSTKRVDGLGLADLGAQFMTSRSPQFQSLIAQGIESKSVALWRAKIASIDQISPGVFRENQTIEDALVNTRYIGFPSMNQWLLSLWPRDKVELNQHITKLEENKNGLWTLHGSSSEEQYSAVILAIPPLQAANLVQNLENLREFLLSIPMDPCWASLNVFEKPLPLKFDAAFIQNSRLKWICANHSKIGRTQNPAAWTLHADSVTSRLLLNSPHDIVAAEMLLELEKIVGSKLPPSQLVVTHRWLYARPTSSPSPGIFWDTQRRLGAGGDWAFGDRVEDAYLAGIALADRLIGDL